MNYYEIYSEILPSSLKMNIINAADIVLIMFCEFCVVHKMSTSWIEARSVIITKPHQSMFVIAPTSMMACSGATMGDGELKPQPKIGFMQFCPDQKFLEWWWGLESFVKLIGIDCTWLYDITDINLTWHVNI